MRTDNYFIYVHVGILDTKMKRKLQYNEILSRGSVVSWSSIAPKNERAQLHEEQQRGAVKGPLSRKVFFEKSAVSDKLIRVPIFFF